MKHLRICSDILRFFENPAILTQRKQANIYHYISANYIYNIYIIQKYLQMGAQNQLSEEDIGCYDTRNGADNVGQQGVAHGIAGVLYAHRTEVDGEDVEHGVGGALD